MSTVREILNRTVEEKLRIAFVNAGYLADSLVHTTPQAYAQANEAIIQDKGYIVNIFGAGTPYKRGEVKQAAIYINRGNDYARRNTAFGTYFKLNEENNTYTKYSTPKNIYNVEYELRIIGSTTNMFNKIEEILRLTFGHPYHKLIKQNTDVNPSTWTLTGDDVYIEISNYSETIKVIAFQEHLMRIIISDVRLDPDIVLEINIPRLTTVNNTINPE